MNQIRMLHHQGMIRTEMIQTEMNHLGTREVRTGTQIRTKVLPVRTEIPVQTGILPTRTTRTEATLSHQTLVLNQVTRAIQAEALQTNPAETKAG